MNIILERVYYLSQIIAVIFVIIGSLIAYKQYKLSLDAKEKTKQDELEVRKREIYERECVRVQRAIDLSSYYKDNILSNINVIKNVYDKSGILSIIGEIKRDNMINFDKIELEQNLSPSRMEKIKKITESHNFFNVLSKESIVYNFGGECIKKYKKDEVEGSGSIQVDIDVLGLFREFRLLLQDTLNNLEYFSLHFTHNTADESVVYQSLHVTFLDTVGILYFDISSNNEHDGERKIYTNVIDMFDIWKKRAKEQNGKYLSDCRKNVEKGTQL